VPLPGTGSIFNDIRGDDLKRGNGGLLENLARQKQELLKREKRIYKMPNTSAFSPPRIRPSRGNAIDRRWSGSETRNVENVCLERFGTLDTFLEQKYCRGSTEVTRFSAYSHADEGQVEHTTDWGKSRHSVSTVADSTPHCKGPCSSAVELDPSIQKLKGYATLCHLHRDQFSRPIRSIAAMADYDRRQSGGHNNRKRRYRGASPLISSKSLRCFRCHANLS
jgi:hypothetical protein